jgi:hypothetical protein
MAVMVCYDASFAELDLEERGEKRGNVSVYKHLC